MSDTKRCQWCGLRFPTVTAHMIHLHDEHPETIGRGRTMSREWSCPPCGFKNRAVSATCEQCGHVDRTVLDANAARTFVVWHRVHPTDTAETSAPMSHLDAVTLAKAFGAVHPSATWNDRRLELWLDGRRIVWLEVAVVTAGKRYIPPRR